MAWEALGNALTFVAACGGAGAAIDFYIGKSGQKRLRERLEDFWLRFSDIRLSNFGREEAKFASSMMLFLIGGFLSRKRLVFLLLVFAVGFWYSLYFVYIQNGVSSRRLVEVGASLSLDVISLSISLSLTICIAKYGARYLRDSYILNILFVMFVLLFQYYMIFFGVLIFSHISIGIKYMVVHLFYVPKIGLYDYVSAVFEQIVKSILLADHYSSWRFISDMYNGSPNVPFNRDRNYIIFMFALPFFTSVFRVFLIVVFFTAAIFRPLHNFFSILILRVAESDKPVCTMVFAGLAAIAKFTQEIAKAI